MSDGHKDGGPAAERESQHRSLLDELTPALYDDLHRLAKIYMARERPDHTLQPTALVHEAYLRLAKQYNLDWSSKAQMLGLAAHMMRRILVKYAQARSTQKRDCGIRVPLDEALEAVGSGGLDIQQVDAALTRLGELDPRQERIVELRFFSGFTVEEIAAALNISTATVKREWRMARLWLLRELDGSGA